MNNHRYNLVMPKNVYETIKSLAEESDTTMSKIIFQCIKVGVFVNKIQKDPNSSLVVREDGIETYIMFL